MKVGIIGSGAMAQGMISGLVRTDKVAPEDITASGPRPERGQELREAFGVRVTTDNREAATGAQVVVLSVKPQVAHHALTEIRDAVDPGALILSIAAGIPMKTIAETAGRDAVVRCMPNSPAQIGHGITVWTHTPQVTPEQLDQTRIILDALGDEVIVQDETYLDMATALSGSGPAYVFLFMQALVDAGVHLGFSRHLAEKLVIKTLEGSLAFYAHEGSHLSRLSDQVTSPGGTSAEALYYLEKARFRASISRAVWAAYEKSVALGRDQGRLHE